MKRVAVWVVYAVGALAIGYLALYAYAAFTGRDLQPGDPIHIFRKPDAPSYSSTTTAPRSLRAKDWIASSLSAPRNDGIRNGYATAAAQSPSAMPR